MKAQGMLHFSQTAEQIAATTKKLQKTALLAEYFRSVAVDEAAVAAVFFSGRPFPMWEEATLQVGGRLLWQIVEELSGKDDAELRAAYREHGDLGAVAEALLPEIAGWVRAPAPTWMEKKFREVAIARGPDAKGALVRQLIGDVSPLEAKYIIKIMTGDLRIGLK